MHVSKVPAKTAVSGPFCVSELQNMVKEGRSWNLDTNLVPVVFSSLSEHPLVMLDKLVATGCAPPVAVGAAVRAWLSSREYEELRLSSLALVSAYLPATTPVPAASPTTAAPRMAHRMDKTRTNRDPPRSKAP
jgi:hypothetical protein